jgi:hypothetical protein
MKKILFCLMATAALAASNFGAQAQAGGITKNGKTQTWKFADSIAASTITLFPSYDYRTPSFTGDSVVVKAAQAITYVKLDSMTADRRVTLAAPQSYFRGGEVLYLDAVSGSSRLLIVQQHNYRYDTITVNTRKKVQAVWNGSKWEITGTY